MKGFDPTPIDCISHSCEWSFDLDTTTASCNQGSGDCIPFHLLELVGSADNDDEIMELTNHINKLVDKANKNPLRKGFKVTLILYENDGQQSIFLKWVDHNGDVLPGKNVVTGKDKPEVVARALGVKGLTGKEE
jgi:hypothetical protein